jgi:hypothetical protein
MKLSNFLFLAIFLFAIMPSISAYETKEVNQNLSFSITSNNASECVITTMDSIDVSILNYNMTRVGQTFYATILSGNITKAGIDVCFNIECSDGVQKSTGDECFSITPNGQEASVGSAVFYVGLIFILIIFLIGCVYVFMSSDNLLAKVGMFGLGYLLLIAITFIGWNMAEDFVSSSPFLIDMLRILFWVLISGALPLLLGAFAWYTIMLFKIKEIERLMTKGMSYDEAERRQGRKYK